MHSALTVLGLHWQRSLLPDNKLHLDPGLDGFGGCMMWAYCHLSRQEG